MLHNMSSQPCSLLAHGQLGIFGEKSNVMPRVFKICDARIMSELINVNRNRLIELRIKQRDPDWILHPEAIRQSLCTAKHATAPSAITQHIDIIAGGRSAVYTIYL